ncbi:MAG: 16S rRNA (cytosine(1402)-N(4))-methyltransferase RsmH [Nitrospira sp.]|nr:16S rRNA (cytosine(1402)-N(4))-methyltransferase RsmH [Nitrospira sp.]
MEIIHLPVLLKEVVEALKLEKGGTYMDATVGHGGHSEEILKFIGSEGRVVGIDRDDEALKMAEARLSNGRVILEKAKFSDMETVLSSERISEADGILFDLGISMVQLRDHERGFSFFSDQRLDMRMDRRQKVSAWDVVNTYPEREIERILHEFGEERLSRKIANAIVSMRRKQTIDTCSQLSGIVERIYRKRGRTHPATKTFQALRIEVNGELNELRAGLDASLRILKKGGRLCIISYHSLEDRMVKHFMRDGAKKGLLTMITKKPVTPNDEERSSNPSSRSAKLRVAEKI